MLCDLSLFLDPCYTDNKLFLGPQTAITGAIAKSAENCQKICQADSTCIAFINNKGNQYCYLMQAVTGINTVTGNLIGPKYCKPTTGNYFKLK